MKEKELEAETVREEILRSVRELKEIRPLLHMIPSYVTAALCADAISAAGGRPLMAQAKEEMEEITGSADGLAVNMGQPSEEKFLSCRLALETAVSALAQAGMEREKDYQIEVAPRYEPGSMIRL